MNINVNLYPNGCTFGSGDEKTWAKKILGSVSELSHFFHFLRFFFLFLHFSFLIEVFITDRNLILFTHIVHIVFSTHVVL